MSDVKARLAAAGWSDKTRGGFEIVAFEEDGIDGFVGLAKRQGHVTAEYWETDGSYYSDGSVSNWDLVPLPAPVAVQDEQPVEFVPVDLCIIDGISRKLRGTSRDEGRRMALELIAARKRIAELEDEVTGLVESLAGAEFSRDTSIDIARGLKKERDELRERLQCPPVQKLATSGPSITRPVPAVDAWVKWHDEATDAYMVSDVVTIDGDTRIISGTVSMSIDDFNWTGPSDRGPWRTIGEVK